MSIICEAFEGLQMTEDFCSHLAKTLKLSYAQHLTFLLAIAQSTQPPVQLAPCLAPSLDACEERRRIRRAAEFH